MQTYGTIRIEKDLITAVTDFTLGSLKVDSKIVGKKISSLFDLETCSALINLNASQLIWADTEFLLLASEKINEPDNTCEITISKIDVRISDIDKMLQKRSYDKLHEILDSMFESAAIADSKGVILRASNSFKDFYGLSPADVIGKNVFELERQKYFSPSVIAKVIKEKNITTLTMKTKFKGFVVVTGIPIYGHDGEIEYVVSFIRDANDYVNLKEQHEALETVVMHYSAELEELREKELSSGDIIVKSTTFRRCFSLALKVAKVDTSLMITGESGVGKSLIAREVHKKSHRQQGPFIEINCGAIPENLLESELFGYVQGAFTGANKNGKLGLIEMAHDGTLFLDEIAELSLSLQVKLLRVLQEKKLTRVGGTKERSVDFRLVVATNKDLEDQVKLGAFRSDLYYRINVVPIHIPPLRERPEDMLPLVLNALYKSNKEHQMSVRLSGGALEHLLAYDWPGNVREVQNMMERLVVTSDTGLIECGSIPLSISSASPALLGEERSLKQSLESAERGIVLEAYRKYRSSVGVGKALGIGQTTAARKLRKYLPGYSFSQKEP